MTAVGGIGSGVTAGGPGTVFIEQKSGYVYHRKLIVDGNNAKPAKPLVIYDRNPSTLRENITELNNATYGFDDVEMRNEVKYLAFTYSLFCKHCPLYCSSVRNILAISISSALLSFY